MYEALDKFLQNDTWHTRHSYDEQRFFVALNDIVRLDDFNADAMAEYFRTKLKTNGYEPSAFENAVHHYQAAARAVHDFLKYTN